MKISTCIVIKVLQELIEREVEQDLHITTTMQVIKFCYISALRTQSRRKATESPSIIIVVVIFLVSWLLPHAISFVNGFYRETSNWEYYPFSFFPIHALAMSFTCYNPFLYAWLNENVCKEFKESCQPEGRLGEWRFECKATARFRIVGSWESTF
jgi:hypothetical protein